MSSITKPYRACAAEIFTAGSIAVWRAHPLVPLFWHMCSICAAMPGALPGTTNRFDSTALRLTAWQTLFLLGEAALQAPRSHPHQHRELAEGGE